MTASVTEVEELLFEVVREHLVRLFPGASLKWTSSRSGKKQVAIKQGAQSLLLRAHKESTRRIDLHRTQPFTDADRRVVECFMIESKALAEVAGNASLRGSAIRTLMERVVARDVGKGLQGRAVVLKILERLSDWSLQTYEGRGISAGFGLVRNSPKGRRQAQDWRDAGLRSLERYFDLPFAPVLGNGIETLLVFDDRGGDPELLVVSAEDGDGPRRFAQVAHWATEDRVAMCLARGGEILVFANGRLMYARRSGRWVAFDRKAATKRWINKDTTTPSALREAVYDTCLDASFARTGACIGIVEAANRGRLSGLVSGDDILTGSESVKAPVLRKIIEGRKFMDLPRPVRLELSGLDGALILDRGGEILAVGAILRVPGGSTGGGRKAAAEALARDVGLGIKVSSDGGVEVFAGSAATSKYRGFAPFKATGA